MTHRMLAVLSTLLTLLMPAIAGADPWAGLVERAAAAHGEPGRRAAEFLRDTRPARDADLDADLLWSNLDLAFRARASFAWARDVPEDLFLNDVLPYAVFDETREDWRPGFLEIASGIVGSCRTAAEAAQVLNREFFNAINVHYNTGRKKPNQSPSESIAQGRATCTGLSIILVNACRAVGIPARAVGVANWHSKAGNHTWVEVWDGRAWRFTGADEYSADGLDRGWFVGDAARAVPSDPVFAVWATSWKPTGRHFPMVWSDDLPSVHAVDVTGRYAPASSAEATPGAVRHFRACAGRERLEAPVRVVDRTGRVVAALTTRAGTADLNDMPSARLEAGSAYTVELDHAGRVFLMPLVADGPVEQTYDLHVEEMTPALSRDEAEAAVGVSWRMLASRLEAMAQTVGEERDESAPEAVHWNGHEMRYLVREFGQTPEGGRSLWISLHGGGGAPVEVNDQQWRNQIRLYEPSEGYYVAPRAPTDTWNLWHQSHIDPLLDALIARFVATRGVDPDRVYLLGYSAGGDGVFQIAPRMADRFAAAAMMAGHPNETTPEGLRNLPFAIFMGGEDSAYSRNTVAAEWGRRLATLAEADPGGYPHRVTIYPGLGHWMNGEDREALPWMAASRRVAWPTRVVWKQDDVTHARLSWLEVLPEDAGAGTLITATARGQTIEIETDAVRTLTLRLRDALVDLDRPITVSANGVVVREGLVRRTQAAIDRSFESRLDPALAATAELTVSW